MELILGLLIILFFGVLYLQCNGSSANYFGNYGQRKEPNDKYIIFQIDCGGLNNIKMQLEILTALAWLSDRTLVLPPETPWYLLGPEPILCTDIFDIDAWRSQIRILTYEEFMKEKHKTDYRTFFKNVEQGEFGKVADPEWSPETKEYFKEEYLKGPINDIKIWYFYCNKISTNKSNLKHRLMTSAECYFSQMQNKKEIIDVIANGVKFKKEFYDRAKKDLKDLGLEIGEYNSIHVRNWEGQTPQQKTPTKKEIGESNVVKNKQLPLLVLSQNVETGALQKVDTEILRPPKRSNESPYVSAIVDMLMAAYAKKFTGSPASTFSTGIMIIRGQLSKTYPKINPNIDFLKQIDNLTCNRDSWNFHIVSPERWEGVSMKGVSLEGVSLEDSNSMVIK
jgi:hypothetical protein